MQYRPLGQSGIEASIVGLGTWAISGWMWGGTEEAASMEAIQASIDEGISLIDTAPAYGLGLAEEIVGKAMAGRRKKVILATKCGLVWHTTRGQYHMEEGGKAVYRFLGADSIRYELEQSLRRLSTDYIDLYQVHWQEATTPIEETLGTLLDLKREGKIRAIGMGNMTVEQLAAYNRVGPVDTDQEEYSMINRDQEAALLPYCRANNIAMIAYSPLAQGLLTGKIGTDRQFSGDDLRRTYSRFDRAHREKVAAMLALFEPITRHHRITPAQLTLAWTTAQRGVTHALVSARNAQQARENARAANVVLSQEELDCMEDAIRLHAADIPHLW